VAYVVATPQALTDPRANRATDLPSDPLPTLLRTHLHTHLPDYMVPAVILPLETMPLTPNGKVDYGALPAPDRIALPDGASHEAPQTPTQLALTAIWSDLLNVPQEAISIHHDFFALGGHSLLASQAASRIRRHFAIEIPLKSYFHRPTIAALAEQIETTQWAVAAASVPLAENEEEGTL
ncbi:MAG: hypothetical protein KDE47_33115, partial [Caldilineaceae bacterium]|nr:hypothetical protein [Caldilineaceae bacterium]